MLTEKCVIRIRYSQKELRFMGTVSLTLPFSALSSHSWYKKQIQKHKWNDHGFVLPLRILQRTKDV